MCIEIYIKSNFGKLGIKDGRLHFDAKFRKVHP